jgi:hypothetical protein
MMNTDILGLLKALADENRLRILGLVAQREYSVRELAEALNVKEPTVSHHLNRLSEAGLVVMRPDGTTHYYRLNEPVLHAFKRGLLSRDQVNRIAADVDEDLFERKVRASFMDGDRILEIPASRKKRQVILRWLVERFEPERAYPQPEVNRIIKAHHPDTATLRRELIASKLMMRERGVFTRVSVA